MVSDYKVNKAIQYLVSWASWKCLSGPQFTMIWEYQTKSRSFYVWRTDLHRNHHNYLLGYQNRTMRNNWSNHQVNSHRTNRRLDQSYRTFLLHTSVHHHLLDWKEEFMSLHAFATFLLWQLLWLHNHPILQCLFSWFPKFPGFATKHDFATFLLFRWCKKVFLLRDNLSRSKSFLASQQNFTVCLKNFFVNFYFLIIFEFVRVRRC